MNKTTKKKVLRILLFLILLGVSYLYQEYIIPQEETLETQSLSENTALQVHYIDVGQGDSILITTGQHSMLIDAGENEYGDLVVNYLKNENITNLDYVIGTHPHSDHIGGIDTVINNFEIEKVIMPNVVHTTKTFEDVIDAMEQKNLSITKPRVGDQYTLGDATFEVLAPISETYDNLNEYSVVIRLVHGENSFLFTADIEDVSENEMLKKSSNLQADVLKLAHHGSAYSNQKDFLDQVDPKIAIVSAGLNNSYGHPHVEVMQAMLDRNITVYRTDKQGSIVISSDGSNLRANVDEYKIVESDLKRKR